LALGASHPRNLQPNGVDCFERKALLRASAGRRAVGHLPDALASGSMKNRRTNMTLVLELKPENARRIEMQAANQSVAPEQLAAQALEAAFPEDDDAQFDAAMNRVFAKYHRAFEVLAEGTK